FKGATPPGLTRSALASQRCPPCTLFLSIALHHKNADRLVKFPPFLGTVFVRPFFFAGALTASSSRSFDRDPLGRTPHPRRPNLNLMFQPLITRPAVVHAEVPT